MAIELTIGSQLGSKPQSLVRFVEKPDAARARRCASGRYLWNAGIFLFSVSASSAYRAHAPELLDAVSGGDASATDLSHPPR
jgi:mannose-1-phosphate guanylyltransferase